MRKNLIYSLAFCLLLPAGLFGQNYQPLPDSNARWITVIGNMFLADFETAIVRKDTLIENKNYILLYTTLYILPIGGYRSETSGRTYFRSFLEPASSLGEFLVFDFSAKPGDTVKNVGFTMLSGAPFNDFSNVELFDLAVDSAGYTQSEPITLKWLYLHHLDPGDPNYCSPPTFWIEGVGGSNGPLNQLCNNYWENYHLHCAEWGDTIRYQAGVFASTSITYVPGHCPPPPIGISSAERKITVGPNPFSHSLCINGLAEEPAYISLYGLTGRLCKYTRAVAGTETVCLSADDLPTGIYFLIIHQNNMETKSYKNKIGLLKGFVLCLLMIGPSIISNAQLHRWIEHIDASTTLNDIQVKMKPYLDSLKQVQDSTLFFSGAGAYKPWMRFSNFWGPRLQGGRTFKQYYDALDLFYTTTSSTADAINTSGLCLPLQGVASFID